MYPILTVEVKFQALDISKLFVDDVDDEGSENATEEREAEAVLACVRLNAVVVCEEEDDEEEGETEMQRRLRRRLQRNRFGMGGNKGGYRGANSRDDDPFAKVKFTIPSFSGAYDAEIYLDWEITVDQKFNSHLVLEKHRVRQATSEFKDFAII